MTSNSSSPNDNESGLLSRRRILQILGGIAMVLLSYRIGQCSGLVQMEADTQTQEAQVKTPSFAIPQHLTASPTMPTSTIPTKRSTSTSTKHDPLLGEMAMPTIQQTDEQPKVALLAQPLIITQREWGGRQPVRGFLPQQPRRITLHHEGVIFTGATPAPTYLRSLQAWSMDQRGWPDIPYHFLIDLEGHIYEGRPLNARGDSNTAYDLQDHVQIALLGKYDKGEQQPNEMQINAIIALIAWLVDQYNIPLNLLRGHRDFIPLNAKNEHIDVRTGERITCPGDNLYRYLTDGTIVKGVEQVLASRITPTIAPEHRYGERQ